MEINKLFEGVELEDNIKETLTGKLEEFKTGLEKSYGERLAEADSKKNEAIESRDKAKTKLRELEDKLAKGDFEGAKELKDSLEKYRTENEAHSKTIEELQEQVETTSKKYNAILQASKDALLGQLESDDLKEIGNKLELEDLRKFVAVHKKSQKDTSTNLKLGKNGPPKTLKEWKAQF